MRTKKKRTDSITVYKQKLKEVELKLKREIKKQI